MTMPSSPPHHTKPLITVITVVYNGVLSIEKTINSVLNQSYKNVEYIIIDGGSKDGTQEAIKKYQDRIDKYISEPDKGIYDAMNKGILNSNGQFLIFMNCGDTFYNCTTIEDCFSEIANPNDYFIIFGNTEVEYPGFTKLFKSRDHSFWRGIPFCHQSAFISTKHHKENLYNTKYKIAADFEFFYSLYLRGEGLLKIDKTISRIETGGVSYVQRTKTIKEYESIVLSKTPKIAFLFFYKIQHLAVHTKNIIKKILPYHVVMSIIKNTK